MSVSEGANKAIEVRPSAQVESVMGDIEARKRFNKSFRISFISCFATFLSAPVLLSEVSIAGVGLGTGLAGSNPEGLAMFAGFGISALLTAPVATVTALVYKKWNKEYSKLYEVEIEKAKSLLYQNFGRSAGLTPEIIRDCAMNREHTWVHNGEEYTVTRDKETGAYTFDREDYFAGVSETHERTMLQSELKPYYLKLKAADVGEANREALKSLLSSVSKLARVELDVEQQHEVKRAIVDATELVEKSEQLAVFDHEDAQRKLDVGLNNVSAALDAIALREKNKAAAALDGYNDYVATTTALTVSS